jgi:hypothetical protein
MACSAKRRPSHERLPGASALHRPARISTPRGSALRGAGSLEEDPRLRTDRDHVDRMLAAFAEYQRLFNLQLEREAKG